MKRVCCNFRLTRRTADTLDSLAARLDISKTAVVQQAINLLEEQLSKMTAGDAPALTEDASEEE